MTAWLLGVLAAALATTMSGVAVFLLRMLLQSRQQQGERLGRLEKLSDIEAGRRIGYEEARRERKR